MKMRVQSPYTKLTDTLFLNPFTQRISMNRLDQRRSWISKHLKIGFNHHERPKAKSLPSSLQSYESVLSDSLSHVVSSVKFNQTLPSLPWAYEVLQFLVRVHQNLQKLVVDFSHPFENWSFGLTDEYLTHTLNLLDLLNSLTKNLSFIHQRMLPLLLNSSASSSKPASGTFLRDWLRAVDEFKPVDYDHEIEEENIAIAEADENAEAIKGEKVLWKGIESANSISLFLIKVLSFCFSGDFDSLLGLKIPLGHEWSVGLMDMQMKICEEMLNRRTEKKGGEVIGLSFQEVVDVNESVRNLLKYISSEDESDRKPEIVDNHSMSDDLIMLNLLKEDMKDKVEGLGGCLDALEMEVDRLFTLVLQARTRLLDALKTKNHQ